MTKSTNFKAYSSREAPSKPRRGGLGLRQTSWYFCTHWPSRLMAQKGGNMGGIRSNSGYIFIKIFTVQNVPLIVEKRKRFKYLTGQYTDSIAKNHLWRGNSAGNGKSPKVIVLALAGLKPFRKIESKGWRSTIFFINLPKTDLSADEKHKETSKRNRFLFNKK